ncbi:hypothetical protein [Paenibacillus dendritiformis]|uniref:hypothetical protein n=1 Tax=Paenibacillus dendritiformis TaxID=130049 RepID=UPI00387E08E0
MTHAQMVDAIQRATGLDSTTAHDAAMAVISELRRNEEIVVEKRVYDAMMNRIAGGVWL